MLQCFTGNFRQAQTLKLLGVMVQEGRPLRPPFTNFVDVRNSKVEFSFFLFYLLQM